MEFDAGVGPCRERVAVHVGILSVIIVSPPLHGTLTPQTSRSFLYTPSANFHGLDGYSYRVSDGFASSGGLRLWSPENSASATVVDRLLSRAADLAWSPAGAADLAWAEGGADKADVNVAWTNSFRATRYASVPSAEGCAGCTSLATARFNSF